LGPIPDLREDRLINPELNQECPDPGEDDLIDKMVTVVVARMGITTLACAGNYDDGVGAVHPIAAICRRNRNE